MLICYVNLALFACLYSSKWSHFETLHVLNKYILLLQYFLTFRAARISRLEGKPIEKVFNFRFSVFNFFAAIPATNDESRPPK